MTDRKPPPRPGPPQPVVVVRRPASTTPSATPGATPPAPAAAVPRPTPSPTPRPTPTPSGAAPTPPRPTPTPGAPRPSLSPRPAGGPPGARPGGPPRFGRPSTPRPPPTPEAILALAVREHVPARIARGELEGKMKARVWRKLHAEEAKRFDQVYALMNQTPGLSLPDAFGVLQSGLSVQDFLARKERTQKKAQVKAARTAVDDSAVAGFIEGLVSRGEELSFVLGERTLLDKLTAVEPIRFRLERFGGLEKLQLVLLARRQDWEQTGPLLERDARLAQKPLPVARQPDRRPFSDPRPFLEHLGDTVSLTLRNGVRLSQPLLAVGRFDLLLGSPGHELFVPLHALTRFHPGGPGEEPGAEGEPPEGE